MSKMVMGKKSRRVDIADNCGLGAIPTDYTRRERRARADKSNLYCIDANGYCEVARDPRTNCCAEEIYENCGRIE